MLLGFYKEPRNTILILERGQIYKRSQKTALTYDQINDPYYQSSYSPLSGIITQGTSNNASQKNYFSELGVDDKAWDLNFRFKTQYLNVCDSGFSPTENFEITCQ